MSELAGTIVVIVNGGALLGFWIWARSEILKVSNMATDTRARVAAIEHTCNGRERWLEGMSKAVNATARNVVRLAQAQNIEVESPE